MISCTATTKQIMQEMVSPNLHPSIMFPFSVSEQNASLTLNISVYISYQKPLCWAILLCCIYFLLSLLNMQIWCHFSTLYVCPPEYSTLPNSESQSHSIAALKQRSLYSNIKIPTSQLSWRYFWYSLFLRNFYIVVSRTSTR